MTTIVPFIPSNIQAPSISLTLDGRKCKAIITWNISSLRYYVNIYDSNNAWIITIPLISSPPARGVRSAVYNPFLNSVVVQLEDPSQWPIPAYGPVTRPGQIVDYTLENFRPSTYNGKFRCMHTDPLTFTFPMITNPGPIAILGKVSRLLNMVESVMQVSTMVYRNGAFEVNP